MYSFSKSLEYYNQALLSRLFPFAPALLASALLGSMASEILRQLEYYFSDLSFPFDDFMMRERDARNSILASTLAGFPRICALTPDLSEDQRVTLLLQAAAESDSIVPLDVPSNHPRVGRQFPIPSEDPAAENSVFVTLASNQLDEAALEKALLASDTSSSFLPVLKLRRLRSVTNKERSYSGAFHVLLESAAKAAALVSAVKAGTLTLEMSAVLLRDHFAEEEEMVQQKRKRQAEKAEKKKQLQGGGPPRGRIIAFEGAAEKTDRRELAALCAEYGHVAYVDFRFGETRGFVRFKNESSAAAAVAALSDAPVEVNGAVPSWRLLSDSEVDAYWSQTKQRAPAAVTAPASAGGDRPVMVYGVVLAFDGVGEETGREEVSALCEQYGVIAHVDYQRGEPNGFVRFKQSADASAALGALSGAAVALGGNVPTWRKLSSEEEDAYKASVQSRKRQRDKASSFEGQLVAPVLEHGFVLSFDHAGESTDREAIRDVCSKYGDIAYIDYQRGRSSGCVRFRQSGAASNAAEALASGAEPIGGEIPRWRVMTPEEEDAYKSAVHSKRQRTDAGKGGKGSKGAKGGRGGGGRAAPRGWLA
ncbi:MAG: hypothetical protein SGPRY_007604 [Prymnesium sp.]